MTNLKAFCSSLKCVGDCNSSFRSAEKPNVTSYKMDCPDCGHVLIWAKERGRLRQLVAKRNVNAKEPHRYAINGTAI